MKVSGFTFIRNAVKNDYPIVEAISSVLPLCDEFVIAHGNSDDGTEELLARIDSPKIRIIRTVWDDSVREGGTTFALETDKAYQAISKDTDWAFYIQGDECLHEKYLDTVKREMLENLNNKDVEGLLFNYKHFYGSYDFFAHSRRWYRREIRVLRHLPGIRSYRDAQGFRLDSRKIKVKHIDAFIYHYGWVKPPHGLNNKVRNFNRFYQNDEWIEERFPVSDDFDYGNADQLMRFNESHPAVMIERIKQGNWAFSYDPTEKVRKLSLRRKVLAWIEQVTGYRPFEYKNYKKVL